MSFWIVWGRGGGFKEERNEGCWKILNEFDGCWKLVLFWLDGCWKLRCWEIEMSLECGAKTVSSMTWILNAKNFFLEFVFFLNSFILFKFCFFEFTYLFFSNVTSRLVNLFSLNPTFFQFTYSYLVLLFLEFFLSKCYFFLSLLFIKSTYSLQMLLFLEVGFF